MKASHTLVKIISLALVLCMALPLVASCTLFGGSLKLESFTVDRSSVKTSYFIGEEIDFSGIKAYVKYSDSSLNTEYGFDDLTITYDPDITATVGQKEVKVSFEDPHLNVEQSTSVQISVSEDPNVVKHESYKLVSTAVKTNYNLGETVDLTGLKLYDVMSDKSEVEVTDLTGLTFSIDLDTVTATAGNKTVTATYNGEAVSGSIIFRVIDPEELKNHVVSAVAGGSYKTTYEVGETIDLTGLTVTVTYEEGEVETLTHEALTVVDADLSTVGTKEITIKFVDPINSEEDFVTITVTVIQKDKVMQFEAPDGLAAFMSDNANATAEYNANDQSFAGKFTVGGQTYVIGDDNEFIFVPTMTVMIDNVPTPLAHYYTVVDITVDGVLLEKTAVSATVYTYALDGETLVTVDTYNGKYQFAKPLDSVKISVLPSAEHYKGDNMNTPVVLNAKVIDAYNVYNAAQLSVIDNYPGLGSGRDPDVNTDWAANNWTTFKAEYGLTGIDPAGVVLHNDIKVTYKDVPSSFFYKSDKSVQYYNTVTGETKYYANTAGMNYLKDGVVLYYHHGTPDFVIEGNFFTIDTSDFPIIASPSIFGDDRNYGSDYSNACLFMFQSIDINWAEEGEIPEELSEVNINNLALRGNAGRDSWVIQDVAGETIGATNELVTAGGLIMLKSSRHAETIFNNCISNSFFISYFPDFQGKLTVNKSKCYDSYQNAAFVWSNTVLTVNDSFINGTGGPVIIAQSIKENNNYFNPIVNLNNTIAETHVTGQEIWFNAVGAVAIVPQITALSAGVNQMLETAAGVKGGWVDNTGKMNIKAILMPRGNNAQEALSDGMIQGTILNDGQGIERWYDPTNENFSMEWATILQHPAFAQGAPFITVYDAAGTAHTLYLVQEGQNGTFYDLNNNALGTDPSHMAIIQAFATADEIILHQGGLSVLFEMYH